MAKGKGGTAVAERKSTALVSAAEEIKKELASLNESTGAPGGDQIRVTQNKTFKLPDGTETGKPIKLLIVDFVTKRSYYDRAFDPKNPCPPACIAISRNVQGMVPFKDVPDKQSNACTGCPMNEWESADSGKGKACKESRSLAVLPPDADANSELCVLDVSPTGLKAFDSYVRSIAGALQKAPFQVITTVSFDPDSTYSSLRFGDPMPADADLISLAVSLRDKARQRLLSAPDFSGYTPPPKKKKR